MVATSRAPGPLHGVTALVTGALVGTGQQNALRSKLASLGANVVGRFCKAVTHVVVLRTHNPSEEDRAQEEEHIRSLWSRALSLHSPAVLVSPQWIAQSETRGVKAVEKQFAIPKDGRRRSTATPNPRSSDSGRHPTPPTRRPAGTGAGGTASSRKRRRVEDCRAPRSDLSQLLSFDLSSPEFCSFARRRADAPSSSPSTHGRTPGLLSRQPPPPVRVEPRTAATPDANGASPCSHGSGSVDTPASWVHGSVRDATVPSRRGSGRPSSSVGDDVTLKPDGAVDVGPTPIRPFGSAATPASPRTSLRTSRRFKSPLVLGGRIKQETGQIAAPGEPGVIPIPGVTRVATPERCCPSRSAGKKALERVRDEAGGRAEGLAEGPSGRAARHAAPDRSQRSARRELADELAQELDGAGAVDGAGVAGPQGARAGARAKRRASASPVVSDGSDEEVHEVREDARVGRPRRKAAMRARAAAGAAASGPRRSARLNPTRPAAADAGSDSDSDVCVVRPAELKRGPGARRGVAADSAPASDGAEAADEDAGDGQGDSDAEAGVVRRGGNGAAASGRGRAARGRRRGAAVARTVAEDEERDGAEAAAKGVSLVTPEWGARLAAAAEVPGLAHRARAAGFRAEPDVPSPWTVRRPWDTQQEDDTTLRALQRARAMASMCGEAPRTGFVALTGCEDGIVGLARRACNELRHLRLCTDGKEEGTVTHLVVGMPGRRSLKTLLAIANGARLMSPSWLSACLEEGRWLAEGPFEVRTDHAAAADRARAAGPGALLRGRKVHVHVKPGRAEDQLATNARSLRRLVGALGAKNVGAWTCDVCMVGVAEGEGLEPRHLPQGLRRGTPLVRAEWLLASAEQYRTLEFAPFSLR